MLTAFHSLPLSSFTSLRYLACREALRALWVNATNTGSDATDPLFYDQVYLPEAQRLTNVYVGRAPMPTATVKEVGGTIRDWNRKRGDADASNSSSLQQDRLNQNYEGEGVVAAGVVEVSLAVADNGAKTTIHYTLTGDVPTSQSPAYTTPLKVVAGTTVRAIAVSDALYDSSRELVVTVPSAPLV